MARRRLRLALPKGRMYEGVTALLAEAGVHLVPTVRSYRPAVNLPHLEIKLLKPRNIVEMLHVGSRDLGFTGADWVAELDGRLVELLDTGLDPVRVVAAAPPGTLAEGATPPGGLVVASEYEHLTRAWMDHRLPGARFVRSYGATEVFPPEDAQVIVDNTATGATLRANGLEIVDELMRSSTRLYANPAVLGDPELRPMIDELVLLVTSVMEARSRVMVEVNVSAAKLETVLGVLPCMREPTISALAGDAGFAVKAAVPRDRLTKVIPALKAAGGTDVVVTRLAQIVP